MPQTPPTEAAREPGLSFNLLMILLTFAGAGLAVALGVGEGRGLAFVFVMASWVLSLCLHEFGHALIAWKGGDETVAPALGLDPRLYADRFGAFVLPILFTLFGGFGFPGGAAPVNRERLRTSGWQAATSAGGAGMNVVFLLFLLVLYGLSSEEAGTLRAVLAVAAFYQATAIVLTLLPIPGLDGYGILRPWLPETLREPGDRIARFSGLVITGLFLCSGAFGRPLFRVGLGLVDGLGFAPQDVVAGYRLMRLW